MNMWIQLHDFSSNEIVGATREQAKEALSTFDWRGELQKEREASGVSCAPGLGLMSDAQELLHICPQNADTCTVEYNYKIQWKLFGLIPPQAEKHHYIDACSFEQARVLIGHHFDGNRDEILKVR